jgi:hypothetical protein
MVTLLREEQTNGIGSVNIDDPTPLWVVTTIRKHRIKSTFDTQKSVHPLSRNRESSRNMSVVSIHPATTGGIHEIENETTIILNSTDDPMHHKSSSVMKVPATISKNATITYYSTARSDRTGAALLDMMRAHAWCMQQGEEYGGACIYNDGSANVVHKEMIDFLGLHNVLKFACPDRGNTSHVMLSNTFYLLPPMLELFSSEWIAIMREHSHSFLSKPNANNAQEVYQVAVHVRRGDVSPCHWDQSTVTTVDDNNRTCQSHRSRYLPNQHYLQIIDRYAPKGANVTIYTESEQPAESLDDFQNVSLYVDGSLKTVWGDMLRSDMLILSKSTFALIPALLAQKESQRVLFTPVSAETGYSKVPGWETVDCNILEATARKLEEFPRNQYC